MKLERKFHILSPQEKETKITELKAGGYSDEEIASIFELNRQRAEIQKQIEEELDYNKKIELADKLQKIYDQLARIKNQMLARKPDKSSESKEPPESKELFSEIPKLKHRIMHKFSPINIDLEGVGEVYKQGRTSEAEEYLEQALEKEKFFRNLKEVGDLIAELVDTVEGLRPELKSHIPKTEIYTGLEPIGGVPLIPVVSASSESIDIKDLIVLDLTLLKEWRDCLQKIEQGIKGKYFARGDWLKEIGEAIKNKDLQVLIKRVGYFHQAIYEIDKLIDDLREKLQELEK